MSDVVDSGYTGGDTTELAEDEKLQRNSTAVSRPWAVSVRLYLV